MDLTQYKKEFKVVKPQTKEQALAEEIWLHFNKKIGFGQLMGIIKRQGNQATRELYNESIKSDHPDHLALFLWKVAHNKVVWYSK